MVTAVRLLAWLGVVVDACSREDVARDLLRAAVAPQGRGTRIYFVYHSG